MPPGGWVSPSTAQAQVGATTSILISCQEDILRARQTAREVAGQYGLSSADQSLVVATVSELAHNILSHATTGEIVLERVDKNGHGPGVVIVARDAGPGVRELEKVLRGGYSTCGGPGLGLSVVKCVMDEFQIVSAPGKGTTVTATKWENAGRSHPYGVQGEALGKAPSS